MMPLGEFIADANLGDAGGGAENISWENFVGCGADWRQPVRFAPGSL
jgi:hypothetical protein